MNSLNIETPRFDGQYVRGWFLVIESQFKLRGIEDDYSKFHNILGALPAEAAGNIPASIMKKKSYYHLKNYLINATIKDGRKALEDFVGTRRFQSNATQYMEELQNLAAKYDAVDTETIRKAFLSAMPESIVPRLAMLRMDLQSLAFKADQLLARRRQDSSECSSIVDGQMPIGITPYTEDQKPKICRGHIYFAEKSKNCQDWCQWPK